MPSITILDYLQRSKPKYVLARRQCGEWLPAVALKDAGQREKAIQRAIFLYGAWLLNLLALSHERCEFRMGR